MNSFGNTTWYLICLIIEQWVRQEEEEFGKSPHKKYVLYTEEAWAEAETAKANLLVQATY